MGCDNQGQADNIRGYVSQYSGHAAHLKTTSGAAIVSTFGGEYCTFGRGSVSAGWNYAVKEGFNVSFYSYCRRKTPLFGFL